MKKAKDQRKQLQLPISQFEKLLNDATAVQAYLEDEQVSLLSLIEPIDIDFDNAKVLTTKTQ